MNKPLTIPQYIAKYGERRTARQLVNQRISKITGGHIQLALLPDSPQITSIIDELEEALRIDHSNAGRIKDVLAAITDEFIEQQVFE